MLDRESRVWKQFFKSKFSYGGLEFVIFTQITLFTHHLLRSFSEGKNTNVRGRRKWKMKLKLVIFLSPSDELMDLFAAFFPRGSIPNRKYFPNFSHALPPKFKQNYRRWQKKWYKSPDPFPHCYKIFPPNYKNPITLSMQLLKHAQSANSWPEIMHP